MGTLCWAGGVVRKLCWVSECFWKKVTFIVIPSHPRTTFSSTTGGRKWLRDSNTKCKVIWVNAWDNSAFTPKESQRRSERDMPCKERIWLSVSFLSSLFDVFPEFMYTLKIIIFGCCFYSRLQAKDEKNVLRCRTSNSRTKKSLPRTYFRVFTRDFHRRSENFFVASNLLIEKN